VHALLQFDKLDGLEVSLERLLFDVRDGTSLPSSDDTSEPLPILARLNRYCRSSTADWS
jgi:hypothetical protein